MVHLIWSKDVSGDSWSQMRHEVARRWPRLQGDDLDYIAGQRGRLVRALQSKYGFMADEANREVEEWQQRGPRPSRSEAAAPSPRANDQFSYKQPDRHVETTGDVSVEPPPESDRSIAPSVDEPIDRPDVIEQDDPPPPPDPVVLGEPIAAPAESTPPANRHERRRLQRNRRR